MSHWEVALVRGGGQVRFLALAALSVLTWRLAVVGWQDELGQREPRVESPEGPRPGVRSRAGAGEGRRGASSTQGLSGIPQTIASAIGLKPRPSPEELLQLVGESPQRPADAGSGDAGPRHLLLTLAIDVGPARSEVFVNGVQKGLTPYFGDHACLEGTPLRVDVLPRRGMPIRMQGVCQPGTLRSPRPR